MLAASLALVVSLTAPAVPDELLVILAETGAARDGLPVYTRHPEPQRYLDVLTRGFSGRLLRVYRDVQQRVSPAAVQPAYLLLSTNEGGFPRHGFWLDDERHADVAYVDLHKSSTLAGRFGAIDQIFPHELMHVMLRQLVGEPRAGGSTQVHAIGVTTDRIVAFQEGFAEHAQAMAIDDEDAEPSTHALAASDREWRSAEKRLDEYRRALETGWPPAPRARIGFLFWFGGVEQAQRYLAVKRNLFAYEPKIAERMLASDLHAAYAWRSIGHGDPSGQKRRLEQLLATEGVVAALFHRLATSRFAAERASDDVYRSFGTTAAAVSPIENAYLKMFHAFARHAVRDAASALNALTLEFPAGAPEVSSIAAEVGMDLRRRPAPEIWLINRSFVTGTSMYDQYAALPRVHAFDLNAASLVDLLGIPGMDRTSADALLGALPLTKLDQLDDLASVPAEVRARIRDMAAGVAAARAEGVEDSVAVSLPKILWSYAWRGLMWIAIAGAAGAWLMSRLRRLSTTRLLVNGLGASAAVLLTAWIIEPALAAPVVPMVLFGLPSAVWTLMRRGRIAAVRTLAAWVLATVPAVIVSTPF